MDEQTKTKLPIWLIISLVANALLIGLLIGGGLGQRQSQPPSFGGSERAFAGSIDRVLSPEDRTQVRRAFRDAYRQTRAQRQEVRAARRDLAALIAADPYDEADVIAAFQALRAADSRAKAGLHDVLAAQLGDLTPEQRKAVLGNLERGERRGARRRGRRSEDRPPRNGPPSE